MFERSGRTLVFDTEMKTATGVDKVEKIRAIEAANEEIDGRITRRCRQEQSNRLHALKRKNGDRADVHSSYQACLVSIPTVADRINQKKKEQKPVAVVCSNSCSDSCSESNENECMF